MSFQKTVRIYFDQGDPANIAFHGQHTLIVQRVMEDFIQKIGIPWKKWYMNQNIFMPVVHYNINFKKPLIPGKEYIVDLKPIRVGKSSLTLNYKIFSLKKLLCCTVIAVYVCVESQKFKSRPFPQNWKSCLEKAMKNKATVNL